MIKQITVFFIPVVLCYAVLEWSVIIIPMSYDKVQQQITTKPDAIKVMVLGSSQMQAAVNPAFLDKVTVNYGSKSQHHKEDNHIMEQSMVRFPNLETIVFELSYAHLEIPHNGKDFWKNTIYLKYYNVNAFERNTYFKDKLVFLSSPSMYAKKFTQYYLNDDDQEEYNQYGYHTNNFKGAFSDLDYNDEKITLRKFRIRDRESLANFAINTPFFYDMIRTAIANKKKVIISCIPTYKTYLNKRNPAILKRRDSILEDIRLKFPEVRFFNLELDTITFRARDYLNENHLNPDGAEKFTKKLNQVLND
ncbi:hypothetical protein [Patiriisocius sp. Uisw_047]|uniref:hypothetical protein n=1 Tax=Patiriisocius sp. Uisw_047 TaxID=3230969 RepID=UPI0039ECEBDD